jgi:putative ATPase
LKKQADLFDMQKQELVPREAPLADRMRPRTLEEFVGQDHLLGPGKVLRQAIESDCLPSMILWGPPGSGKTTLAMIIVEPRVSFVPLAPFFWKSQRGDQGSG